MLTPGERLAVYQVVKGGGQSIILGDGGNATGGSFTIGSKFSQYVSDVTVPANVTAMHNAGVASTLNLVGNITNAGSIFSFSTNPSTTTATFTANNITNQGTGIISTVLPNSLQSQLPAAITNLSLALNARNDIINYGTISSASALNVFAANNVLNGLSSVANASPVMSAVSNLNMQTGSGFISNLGTLTSGANLNLSSVTGNLVIDNIGGSIRANNTLNIGAQDNTQKLLTHVLGGSLQAQDINIFAGDGAIRMNVESIMGTLNVSGGSASIQVQQTEPLKVGNFSLTGDPNIFNGNGDIAINGNLTFSGQNLAIVAAKNVYSTETASINTSGDALGGDISIVAGAVFLGTVLDSSHPKDGVSNPPGGIWTHYDPTDPRYLSIATSPSIITITELGSTGGKIDLSTISQINTSSANGAAGNVKLIAIGGDIKNAGSIITAGATRNGDVQMIANNGVATGSINTVGAATAGGSVSLTSGQPYAWIRDPSGSSFLRNVTFTDGKITFGGFSNQSPQLQTSVLAGDITALDVAVASALNISTNGNIHLGNLDLGPVSTFVSNNKNGNIIIGGVNAKAALSLTGKDVAVGVVRLTNSGSLNVNSRSSNALKVGGGAGGSNAVKSITWDANASPGGFSFANDGTGGVTLLQDISLQKNTPINLNAANGQLDVSSRQIITNGAINLTGGAVNLDNSTIRSDSANPFNGSIRIVGDSINGTNTIVSANSTGQGSGGLISFSGNSSNSIALNGGGTMLIQSNGGNSGFGGSLRISSGTVSVSPGLHISMESNGGTNGGGGGVFVQGNSGATNLALGNGAGQISIQANGGSGGFVTVNSGGDINVKTDALQATVSAASGNGGFVLLQGGTAGNGTILIDGDVHLDGKGSSGEGGGLTINAPTVKFDSEKNTSISANGSGTGSGGTITIQSTSATSNLEVSNNKGGLKLVATGGSSGSSAGNGGEIDIEAGGNLVASGDAVNVDVLGTNGQGGTIKLASGFVSESDICCPGGQFVHTIETTGSSNLQFSGTVAANGKGTGNGGTVWLAGPNISSSGSSSLQVNGRNGGVVKIESSGENGVALQNGIEVQANAISGGTNGSISIMAARGDVQIGNGIEPVTLLANVGSASSASGNGGTVTVSAGRNLHIASGSTIDVFGGAANGNGGNVSLTAGTAGEGVITIDGSINANGGATKGSGGTVKLTHNATTAMMLNGSILADSGASGDSGHVEINSTNAGELRFDVNGTLSAFSEHGLNTSLKSVKLPFDQPNSGIWIHVSPQGKINANVDLQSGYIKLDAGNGNVLINQLAAQQGSIDINATGSESRVSILPGKTVQAKDRITIRTTELRNDGVLKTLATGSKIEVIGDHDLKFGGIGTIELPDNSAFSLTSNLGTLRVENSPTISGTTTSSVSFNALSLEPSNGTKCIGCVHFGIDLNLKVSAGTFKVSGKDIGFNQNAKITTLLGGTNVVFAAPQESVDLFVHNVDNGSQAVLAINQTAQRASSFELSGNSVRMNIDGLTIDTSTAAANAKGGDITLKATGGQFSIAPASPGKLAVTLVTRSDDSVGGQVTIESKTNLSLDSVKIQTNSNGTGNGGNVSIKSTGSNGTLSLTGTKTEIQTEGGITKSDSKTSSGGTITIAAPQATVVEGLFSSDGGYRGNGGKVVISIESGNLQFGSGGNFAVSANSGVNGGDAADIEISAGSIKANSLSLHSDAVWVDDFGHRTGTGQSGHITLTAKDGDITVNERDFSLIADGGNGQIQVHADAGSIKALTGTQPIRFKTGGRQDNSSAPSVLLSSGKDMDLGLIEINANGDQLFSNGGLVQIIAKNNLSLYGEIAAKGDNAGLKDGGDGGTVILNATTLDLGQGSSSGLLNIDVAGIAAPNNSQIIRKSGIVQISASNDSRELAIYSSTSPTATSRSIKVSGLFLAGAGGQLEVTTKGDITIADSLHLEGLAFAGGGRLILSTPTSVNLPTLINVSGNAGSANISAGDVHIASGGTTILADGSTFGSAGSITITANSDLTVGSGDLIVSAQPLAANPQGSGGQVTLTATGHLITVSGTIDVSGGPNDPNIARIVLNSSRIEIESNAVLSAPEIRLLTTSSDRQRPSIVISGQVNSTANLGHIMFQNDGGLWIALNDGKVDGQLVDVLSQGAIHIAGLNPDTVNNAGSGYWSNIRQSTGSNSLQLNLQLIDQTELLLGNISSRDSVDISANKAVTLASSATLTSAAISFEVPTLNLLGHAEAGRSLSIAANTVRVSNEAISRGTLTLSPLANSLTLVGSGNTHLFSNLSAGGVVEITQSAVLHLDNVSFNAANGVRSDASFLDIKGAVETTGGNLSAAQMQVLTFATLTSSQPLTITVDLQLVNDGLIKTSDTFGPTDLTIRGPRVTQNGLFGEINASGELVIRNDNGNLTITGARGTLRAGTNIRLISDQGSVQATVGSIRGVLNGVSQGNFDFTAKSVDPTNPLAVFNVGKITAGSIDHNQDQLIHLRLAIVDVTTLKGNLDPGFITIETEPGSSGTLVLGTNLVASNTVSINLTDSVSLQQMPGFFISAPHTVLTSELGTIGTSEHPIMIDGGSVTASSAGGQIFVGSTGSTAIDSISSTSPIHISAASQITVAGSVSAPLVDLNTTIGSSAGITISGSLTAETIRLIADGLGSVDTSAGSIHLSPAGVLDVQGNSVIAGIIDGGASLSLEGRQQVSLVGEVGAPQASLSVKSGGAVSVASPVTVQKLSVTADRFTNNAQITANAIDFSGGSLVVSGNGTLIASNIGAASTSGAVLINQNSISGTISGSSVQSFAVNVAFGGLTIGSLSAGHGNIEVVANGRELKVIPASQIKATEGDVILQNLDVTGSIFVGSNSAITASAAIQGQTPKTYLVLGAVPDSPVGGSSPANTLVTTLNGGAVYFGANGVTANCCGNSIAADAGLVVLSTESSSSGQLVLDGSVSISSRNTNPTPPPGPSSPLPPGHGGTPPGQGGLPPGLGGGATPGHGSLPPGAGGTPPGKGNTPGHGGTAPGQLPYSTNPKTKTGEQVGADKDALRPVGFVRGARTSEDELWVADMPGRFTLRSTGDSSVFLDEQNNLKMRRGEVLVRCSERMSLFVDGHDIECRDGDILLINHNGNTTKIRCLDGTFGRPIVVRLDQKREAKLVPGQELVVAKLSDAELTDSCARRNIHRMQVSDKNVIASEFSYTSLACVSNVLRRVLRETDSPEAKRILKTAACLSVVTSKHGPFGSER